MTPDDPYARLRHDARRGAIRAVLYLTSAVAVAVSCVLTADLVGPANPTVGETLRMLARLAVFPALFGCLEAAQAMWLPRHRRRLEELDRSWA